MADPEISEAGDSAEKAYAAAAAETAPVTSESASVEFPSKASRSRKPRTEVAEPAVLTPTPEPPIPEPVAAKPAAPIITKTASPPKAKAVKRPSAKVPIAKPIAAKPAASKPKSPARKPATVPIAKPSPAPKPATAVQKTSTVSQLKDKIMATQTTAESFTASKPFTTASDFVGSLKGVVTEAQEKAKAAFEKGTASFGDVTEFAKGNVEAVVESGKILASGLQEFGSTYVTESKSAFEAVSADVKELAAQKTPVDFFKLQGELAKKNFDSAMAFGTKSNEAWMKLASDAFAPISGRVSLAVEKFKTAV